MEAMEKVAHWTSAVMSVNPRARWDGELADGLSKHRS
jgi:hypothetical protein